jgi:hypothetical protein
MTRYKMMLILYAVMVAAPSGYILYGAMWPVPARNITAVRPDPAGKGQYQIFDSDIGAWGWIGQAIHAEHRDAQLYRNAEILRYLVAEDGAYAVLVNDPRAKVLKRQAWVVFTPDFFQDVQVAQGN